MKEKTIPVIKRKNLKKPVALYTTLCDSLNLSPVQTTQELSVYHETTALAQYAPNERLTAALQALIDCMLEEKEQSSSLDSAGINYLISKLDQKLSAQMDEILHHPNFQSIESLWKGLASLVRAVDTEANVKIDLLNVSKEELKTDFQELPDLSHAGLYQQIYEQEYDMPGGEPISAMITNFDFDASGSDLDLLSNMSKIAAMTHAPVIGSVKQQFFGKPSFAEVVSCEDLSKILERAEYLRWNAFRATEEARYIGLVCPRILQRLPYGMDSPVRTFFYEETVSENPQYLWGSAAFAFAINLVKSFQREGWMVNIRGPESGGKVEGLCLHSYDVGHGFITKIPTETLISESLEFELSELGFIPLCYYKNSDYACFFSAHSVQKPAIYNTAEASANSRINARLPYIFLSSRIAHYLKVLQRETIGSNVSCHELGERLNHWLQTLITRMNHPDAEQIAEHPLKDGRVEVTEIDDNPGFYRVTLYATPHFQVEGMNVNLSVVGKMPIKREEGKP